MSSVTSPVHRVQMVMEMGATLVARDGTQKVMKTIIPTAEYVTLLDDTRLRFFWEGPAPHGGMCIRIARGSPTVCGTVCMGGHVMTIIPGMDVSLTPTVGAVARIVVSQSLSSPGCTATLKETFEQITSILKITFVPGTGTTETALPLESEAGALAPIVPAAPARTVAPPAPAPVPAPAPAPVPVPVPVPVPQPSTPKVKLTLKRETEKSKGEGKGESKSESKSEDGNSGEDEDEDETNDGSGEPEPSPSFGKTGRRIRSKPFDPDFVADEEGDETETETETDSDVDFTGSRYKSKGAAAGAAKLAQSIDSIPLKRLFASEADPSAASGQVSQAQIKRIFDTVQSAPPLTDAQKIDALLRSNDYKDIEATVRLMPWHDIALELGETGTQAEKLELVNELSKEALTWLIRRGRINKSRRLVLWARAFSRFRAKFPTREIPISLSDARLAWSVVWPWVESRTYPPVTRQKNSFGLGACRLEGLCIEDMFRAYVRAGEGNLRFGRTLGGERGFPTRVGKYSTPAVADAFPKLKKKMSGPTSFHILFDDVGITPKRIMGLLNTLNIGGASEPGITTRNAGSYMNFCTCALHAAVVSPARAIEEAFPDVSTRISLAKSSRFWREAILGPMALLLMTGLRNISRWGALGVLRTPFGPFSISDMDVAPLVRVDICKIEREINQSMAQKRTSKGAQDVPVAVAVDAPASAPASSRGSSLSAPSSPASTSSSGGEDRISALIAVAGAKRGRDDRGDGHDRDDHDGAETKEEETPAAPTFTPPPPVRPRTDATGDAASSKSLIEKLADRVAATSQGQTSSSIVSQFAPPPV